MIEFYLILVILSLVVVLIASQVGWMIYSNKMVDKAMARSIGEYTYAKRPEVALPPKEFGIKLPQEEDFDQAGELNRLMGL